MLIYLVLILLLFNYFPHIKKSPTELTVRDLCLLIYLFTLLSLGLAYRWSVLQCPPLLPLVEPSWLLHNQLTTGWMLVEQVRCVRRWYLLQLVFLLSSFIKNFYLEQLALFHEGVILWFPVRSSPPTPCAEPLGLVCLLLSYINTLSVPCQAYLGNLFPSW